MSSGLSHITFTFDKAELSQRRPNSGPCRCLYCSEIISISSMINIVVGLVTGIFVSVVLSQFPISQGFVLDSNHHLRVMNLPQRHICSVFSEQFHALHASKTISSGKCSLSIHCNAPHTMTRGKSTTSASRIGHHRPTTDMKSLMHDSIFSESQ